MSYKEWVMGAIDDATYKDSYRMEEIAEKQKREEELRRWAGEDYEEDDEE